MAHGQAGAGTGIDLSGLTPPPSASDSNSFTASLDTSNVPPPDLAAVSNQTGATGTNSYGTDLAMAVYFQKTSQPERAEPILINLLAGDVPVAVQKQALLDLGSVVRDENDLPRAQTIYAQFINRWPDDSRIPEVFLRQGEIFRQMGLTDMALGKFYSVMASALALKNDQFAYYQKLVLQTQIEIAETHYLMGHYVDAADFYTRLLQNSDPGLNRPQMEFRLVRSLTILGKNEEATSEAMDFLTRYPDSDEVPEVRYYLAQALKAQGRDNDALQQVLLCLKQQKAKSGNDPAVWTYWQQRVGNELANQLYHEGDYVQALEIYVALVQLDSSATWQIPVYYQMGLTYEKLMQPQKATDSYTKILARQTEVGTNATPGMQAIFDMARWRTNFLSWQQNAQTVDQSLAAAAAAMANLTNSAAPAKQ
ncbi:MAG TPA: tetratricopeptide repeat protein [Pseudomonadales bacterium]|nr:tetratricopeptide repeat protein [Pseudomonadales bacterium]